MSSKPRLTREQAEKVDREAEGHNPTPELIAAYDYAQCSARILDLLDQLRDTTARAEQAEKDAALLARHLTRPYEHDAYDALKRGLQHSIRLACEAHDSAALQRAKGGAA